MDGSQREQARRIALILLKSYMPPTSSQVEDCVSRALSAFDHADDDDRSQIIKDIEGILSIWVADGTELRDDTGHVPWLPDKRASIAWDFWRRYQTYLEEEKGLPPQVVEQLDRFTDAILERIEDPKRPGPWDRRGMIVGQVQSGKTANYIGLVCKAVDAGYKLVIVLTGMHNSLRSQTQLRLDEGFLGRDTKLSRVFTRDSGQIGVGLLPTGRVLAAHSLTSSADHGDFRRAQATSVAAFIGSDPVLLVVKKNKSVLDNLLNWATATSGQAGESGRRVIRGIPLLLLDDEADNASVNTNPLLRDESGGVLRDQDVTAINGLIRRILNTFEQSAYVGYTATPFANIFIYPQGETETHGEDLFPRSFIRNLPAPSNYTGPVQVFGLQESSSGDSEDGLPVVRVIDDYDHLIPSSHRRTLTPTDLPDSLKEAMCSFVLSCAARAARGQAAVHNSMLVHVTRFTAVQQIVHDLVQQELTTLKRRIEFGDGNRSPSIMEELRELWERDYVPTTLGVGPMVRDDEIKPLRWDAVKNCLHEAVIKIGTKLINGTAADVLDYYDHPNGISVVAIGGDKLSRGLTLEGLTVSYYLRASRMYDTLMQMGRWFGYRPGYADLCRLYTSQELIDRYKHITLASEELRHEFDRMAFSGRTPEDFGLRVQTHPGGMTVTGASKMRSGTRLRVSFDGTLVESYAFRLDSGIVDANFAATDAFLSGLELQVHRNGYDYCCEGVPGAEVAAFLSGLGGHPEYHRFNPQRLQEYVERKLTRDELTEWTVVLINNRSALRSSPYTVGGKLVGLTYRANSRPDDPSNYWIKNRHLISGGDDQLDLSDDERARALRLTRDAWESNPHRRSDEEPKTASPTYTPEARPATRGLLLIYPLNPREVLGTVPFIGFAVAFPRTGNVQDAVEYVVNNVYWNEEFGEG